LRDSASLLREVIKGSDKVEYSTRFCSLEALNGEEAGGQARIISFAMLTIEGSRERFASSGLGSPLLQINTGITDTVPFANQSFSAEIMCMT
jgi:hypothetical protein